MPTIPDRRALTHRTTQYVIEQVGTGLCTPWYQSVTQEPRWDVTTNAKRFESRTEAELYAIEVGVTGYSVRAVARD